MAKASSTAGRVARHLLGNSIIVIPAIGLLVLTWIGTLSMVNAERQDAEQHILAQVTNQAISFQTQLHRQVLELDQTLRILVAAWEANPAKFDLAAAREHAVALSDISRDLLLADDHGLIVQSTVPEAVGINVARKDYFTYALQHGATENDAFVGPATVDPILRQWHMEVARWMRHPDGSFGGVIVADWRISAINDVFRNADLGPRALEALVSLTDGKLRAIVGPNAGSPDELITDTPLFAAIQNSPDGTWVGPSLPDGIERVLAFRRIPGRDLVVVVGVDHDAALSASYDWENQLRLFAGLVSVLIVLIAGMLMHNRAQLRRRQTALAYDRTVLAAANAQLEVAKAHADSKAAQLEATLDGMTDGVSMMDAQLCLVEWNRRFPEIAGVPDRILRVGLPMEDVLRAQAAAGQFGRVDVEAEVTRRMALLRSGGHVGTMERVRPDGRTLELRRNSLPDGGFVTLYSDVTARKRAENALREARATAEAATEAKSRFVAIVSHEIRTPLNALLSTLTLLHDGGLPPAQQALLDMARQSGDALLGLINDILEMARMEAGQLTLRPSTFSLRSLLEGVVEIFSAQAAERGITLRLALAPDLPTELHSDPGRIRQVLINLVSNAVKFGQPGVVGLLARKEQDAEGADRLLLAVRDRGPVIEPEGRARLFRPFSRLESGSAGGPEPIGSGLGLAICRQLVTMMGGEIGCDTWVAEDRQPGNEFWVRLPLSVAAARVPPSATDSAGPARRIFPRTRILLVEDILANQLVTATLLRREGHLVDIASSGEAALEAVAQRPYDLVFMDIFMPGMNGFEAARKIRGLPGPARSVPIVALTANVSEDDQAAGREAGMNRLLGKPVALPQLLQAIGELVWRGLSDRAGVAPAARPDAGPTGPVLSSERITELRTSLPIDMLGGMVEECLIDMQARLPDLHKAIASGSAEEIAAQAHAMVGMAAGYGMSALEIRLRALMQAARGSDRARAAVLAEDLEAELARSADALREALAIETV